MLLSVGEEGKFALEDELIGMNFQAGKSGDRLKYVLILQVFDIHFTGNALEWI